MDARAHKYMYVDLTEIMPPDTVLGVGAITKLHFIIFAAFKVSVTLTFAQMAVKVIHFGGNQKPMGF